MSNFEDFIKENTKFESPSTQEELNRLKLLQKKKVFDLKITIGTLTLASAFVAALVLFNTSPKSNESVSDLVAEDYMVEVFLAVDDEISDSEPEEGGLL